MTRWCAERPSLMSSDVCQLTVAVSAGTIHPSSTDLLLHITSSSLSWFQSLFMPHSLKA